MIDYPGLLTLGFEAMVMNADQVPTASNNDWSSFAVVLEMLFEPLSIAGIFAAIGGVSAGFIALSNQRNESRKLIEKFPIHVSADSALTWGDSKQSRHPVPKEASHTTCLQVGAQKFKATKDMREYVTEDFRYLAICGCPALIIFLLFQWLAMLVGTLLAYTTSGGDSFIVILHCILWITVLQIFLTIVLFYIVLGLNKSRISEIRETHGESIITNTSITDVDMPAGRDRDAL